MNADSTADAHADMTRAETNLHWIGFSRGPHVRTIRLRPIHQVSDPATVNSFESRKELISYVYAGFTEVRPEQQPPHTGSGRCGPCACGEPLRQDDARPGSGRARTGSVRPGPWKISRRTGTRRARRSGWVWRTPADAY